MSRSEPFSQEAPGGGGGKIEQGVDGGQKNGPLWCGCSGAWPALVRIGTEDRQGPSEGPWPTAERDPELSRAVDEHLNIYCGKLEGVVHERQSGLVYLEVFVYGPTEEHAYIDLFTAGMSQLAMNDPHARHSGWPDRTELLLQLPAEWAGGKPVLPQFDDPEKAWPVRLLQRLARLPHERGGCVENGSMVAWDDGMYPGLPFAGAMYMTTAWCTIGIAHMIRPDIQGVDFLQVIPLHASELAFAREQGPLALQDRLLAAGVDDTVQLDRVAVV